MIGFLWAAVIILCIISGVFIGLFIDAKSKYGDTYERFKDVIDIEKEKTKAQKSYDKFIKKQKEIESELINQYNKKKDIYDKLSEELTVLEEHMEFIECGMYDPHFDFDTSEKYKDEINENRIKQKNMLKKKTAATCHTEWTVGGSKAEGKKMTDRNIRLMLRAFNNECDADLLKVTWNNVDKMEKRIVKAFEAINKLGEPNSIAISNVYLRLKLDELFLTHEYREKVQEEKEEQRRIKEQMREEEKVQREIEKAKLAAEREENQYEAALVKAKEELKNTHGEELSSLEKQIKLLEEKLEEAHERKDRALSRAQMTKSGHVYVISNIGSFGEDVYKIGMTRRLEPLDRVKELGDASVPFSFDVHAMIYSDNAPELEAKLHNTFNDYRLNLINNRKEFFNVTLKEIEQIVLKDHGQIEFTKLAEAKEYRESVSKRNGNIHEIKQMKEPEVQPRIQETFPSSL